MRALLTLVAGMTLWIAGGAGAQAQTIENVAQARWTVGGRDLQTQSNRVVFQLGAVPATIEVLHPVPSGGQDVTAAAARCNGQMLAMPAAVRTGAAPISAASASAIRPGETLILRIASPTDNRDPGAIDTLEVEITTASGERELFVLAEDAPDSGVFVGAVSVLAQSPAVASDCRLTAVAGEALQIRATTSSGGVVLSAAVPVLADPFGLVFDSADGAPIDGVRVTLIEAASGALARVFADDGVTSWPSSVITGQTVIDGAGNAYPMPPGEYRFPLAPLGSYRLVIEPPAPYTAPSKATPAQLMGILRPNGQPVEIIPASYGASLALASPAPVRVDVPLDRPRGPVLLSKTVSRPTAAPGDPLVYAVTVGNPENQIRRGVTLTDNAGPLLRLQPGSIRIDGVAAASGAVQPRGDGRGFTLALGDLAAGATRRVTYAMRVRPDADAGQAINRVTARDALGEEAAAEAVVRIEREFIAARMTIIGRVTAGDCSAMGPRAGIPGVRVMLEDGSFALTDRDGRYHFEGIVPGTHVVQAQESTLPGGGGGFVDCAASTRSAGSAASRFVSGQGGSMVVADFAAAMAAPPVVEAAAAIPASDAQAAGGQTDFVAMGDGPIDWLFPAADHNPRAPAVRVAIRHRPGQTVALSVDGRAVDAVAFDGLKTAPSGAYAVSVWRGIPLTGETTRLSAVVRDGNGAIVTTLTRDVHFAATAAQVAIVPERSRLVADGATRPVLAVRISDRQGRPVHAGMAGELSLNAPYESAQVIDELQLRQLSGVGGATPRWVVKGDDGVALIELAPTMVSGALRARFAFVDGEVRREQTLDAWVVPGAQKWTLVGLAEGALGSRTVAEAMKRKGRFDSDLGKHARVAFYAKGRVLGRTLLTVAYDSAKQKDDQRLLGAIDPNAYYTVFADGSDRRFDAASREKLYVRLESRAYYALYGDFEAGFDQTELARYLRTATGLKAEATLAGFHAQAFAARIATRHRRDEIQGNGLSGPYRLSSRTIVANSETVTIETRDRLRSELVLSRKPLSRFLDYDIDPLSGTITFSHPVLSRDADLNPQVIVIDFDSDEAAGGGELNGGVRADWTGLGGNVRIGASVLSDRGDGPRVGVAALDLKARLDDATEIRAEVGASRRSGSTDGAWLVEAEHHGARVDLLAYARSLDPAYGLGQQNRAERGRRKIGADARYALADGASLTASVWRDDALDDATRRQAGELRADLRRGDTDARVGLAWIDDRLLDGRDASSTVLQGGVTRRLFDNRLELDGTTSVALGGTESIDLPNRHRLAARYALTSELKVLGSYEIAEGEAIDARTARVGLELAPWAGAKLVSTLGTQAIAEQGKRSFAAFGLAQSWQATPKLTLDATLDGNRVLGGFDASRIIDPDHPVASGGFLGEGGVLSEDFTAVTLGAGYRAGRWSATARGEYRAGDLADRKGLTLGVIRQIGEGSVVGSGFTWTRAKGDNGARSAVLDAAISAAIRPADAPWALLTKVEYRSDSVSNAIAGEAGPAGRSALTIDGNGLSRRLIGSASVNWSPTGRDAGRLVQRSEVGVFVGGRYGFDRVEGLAAKGTTALLGLDARIGVGERIEVGGSATVRRSLDDHVTGFAIGPQVGFVPAKDMLVTVGYNVTGFRDRDFREARSTDRGAFASVKLKFDNDLFGRLGLRR